MTEEQIEKVEDEFKEYRGTYIGEKFVTECKNGSVMKKAMFVHKGFDGEKKEISFDVFSPLKNKDSLQMEHLTQGKKYHVFYIAKQTTSKGNTWIAKQVWKLVVTESDKEGFVEKPKVECRTPQQQVANNQIPKLALDPLKFAESYRDSNKPMADKTKDNFVHNFYFKTDRETVELLHKLYSEIVHGGGMV